MKKYNYLFEAIKDLDVNCKNKLFAKQFSHCGKRYFISTTPERFWNMYVNLKSTERKYCEIILNNCPCKFYLDCEYAVQFNEGLDTSTVIKNILDIFSRSIVSFFGSSLFLPDNTLVLDSSTNKKVSFHIIFKNLIFENNKMCKIFAQYVIKNSVGEDNTNLHAFDKNSERTVSIVDMLVYNTNQNFRIVGSSKYGKSAELKILEQNNMIEHKCLTEELFQDSLVSNKDFVVNTRSIENLLLSANPSQVSITTKTKIQFLTTTSAYPHLDACVKAHIGSGSIRRIKIFNNNNTTRKPMLLYDIENYRHCDNIKRTHKSNKIYFIGDVFKSVIYQKCYDKDCIGFRGKDIFVDNKNV